MSLPLLSSSRPSSEIGGRDNAEDSLLGRDPGRNVKSRCSQFWVKLGLAVWALVATLAAIIVLMIVCWQTQPGYVHQRPEGKRSVIFMVSDGMGPTSLALTRSFRQQVESLPYDNTLVLDKHLIGTSRTRSTSSLVTDSAAGATAFSCGTKSYNGAISVIPGGQPCGTVLEAAKLAGYKTGLVVTTRITDATPACFSAHVHMRSEEDLIAQQQLGENPLGRVVDLMLGGGRCHFLPNTTADSCRGDARDLVADAQDKYGFTYVDSRAGFDSLKQGNNIKLPLLGLFANTDIPFEIDRKAAEYPSLDEMTEAALNALEAATKDSDQGFFLMVEGSRIDHAGHENDPAAQVHEVLAYDLAFARVIDWVDTHNAVVVSTSDHETGGLAIARQLHESYPEYLWYPQVLGNATQSSEFLAAKYFAYSNGSDRADEETFIKETLLRDGLGIQDASDEEVAKLKTNKAASQPFFADIISRRAQVGWSTHGHSGVDVNIYGSKGTSKLNGNHENSEIGKFLEWYLGVNLEDVTKKLVQYGTQESKAASSWLGRTAEELLLAGVTKSPLSYS